ncbi:MAG: cupin domain-containing protein [Chitinophagaceae bacterium]
MSTIVCNKPEIFHYIIQPTYQFPNSYLPVLIYKNAFQLSDNDNAEKIEDIFIANNWGNCWQDGIFNYQHYHSITHEVLAVYTGECNLQLGGENGISTNISKGDVVIIPAGLAHKNLASSHNFKCIGAYPKGLSYDIKLGKPEEKQEAEQNIKQVLLPETDPVFGKHGLLFEYWKNKTN